MIVAEAPVEITTPDYAEFLAGKRIAAEGVGFQVRPDDLNPALFDWQREIVAWALMRGRSALFEDCGLGKTAQELAWAEMVYRKTLKPVLIVAPLGVAGQTVREGEKFGIPVRLCRSPEELAAGVNVTNYERVGQFDPSRLGGLVLDESSILKGDGPLCRSLIQAGSQVSYRLAATATPAPNDIDELINHAEFLGIMRGDEILALYFTQDGNTTHKWRLKRHAEADFWAWVSTWAVALRNPSDLGYSGEGFVLPAISYHQHTVETAAPTDALFQAEARGIQDQRRVRKATLTDRCEMAAALVNGNDEPWIVWCDLNSESQALTKLIPGAVEVTGSDPLDTKEARLLAFSEGRARVIVSKPGLAGFGLNWQHCSNQVFVGLGNSYERYYQAIRRSHRYGQRRPVQVHVITSEADGPVVRNIERKERDAAEMMDQLVKEVARTGLKAATASTRETMDYAEDVARGRDWTLYLGDCVEQVKRVETESQGLVLFSPPFPSMYVYTNSPRDIGNVASFDELISHFRYLIPELLRITLPGRSCAIHLTQALSFIGKDGHSGMKDFRGAVIRAMEEGGWHYYGEVTIDKNPQLKAIRTKDRGLLFKTLATDASHMHMALADYLLQFRKPGVNPIPIRAGISEKYGNPNGWISQEQWIRWARPVWYGADFCPDGDGIAETDVLNVNAAREEGDERHLCPLQLGVIRRASLLWSNPLLNRPDWATGIDQRTWEAGASVFTPFAGIGSELYQAICLGRKAVGIELKRSYFEQAVRNLKRAECESSQLSLMDLLEAA